MKKSAGRKQRREIAHQNRKASGKAKMKLHNSLARIAAHCGEKTE